MAEEKRAIKVTEIRDLTIAAISLFILILFLFAVYVNESKKTLNETPIRCSWPGVMSCSPRGEVQFCTASNNWRIISQPCICAISEDQIMARCITTTVDAGLQIRD